MKRWLLLALLIGGCDDPPPTPHATSGSASAVPTPTATYTASIDGKPITFRSVLAMNKGGSAMTVHFSTHEMKCEHLGKLGRMLADGERGFNVTIAPKVKQGDKGWGITKSYFSGANKHGAQGDATVQAAANEELDVRLTVALESAAPDGEKVEKLAVDGQLRATNCGTVHKENTPEPKLQRAFKLNVSRRPIPVNGATLTPLPSGFELEISNGPLSCGGFAEGDIVLELTLSQDGQITKAFARGDLMVQQTTTTSGLDGLLVKAEGLDGGGKPEIAMSGPLEIDGALFKVSGVIKPDRCPAKTR